MVADHIRCLSRLKQFVVHVDPTFIQHYQGQSATHHRQLALSHVQVIQTLRVFNLQSWRSSNLCFNTCSSTTNNQSSLEHKTLGALHGISYMLQQLHAERRQLKGWGRGETGMRLMLYLHSSVIQGATAHSSNNPSVLYRTPYCGVVACRD